MNRSSIVCSTATIHGSARIDPDALIVAKSLVISEGAYIGAGTKIIGDTVSIGKDTTIVGSTIRFSDIRIGLRSKIDSGSLFESNQPDDSVFQIGDGSFFAGGQKAILPKLAVGDYTAIHDRCLINGYEECRIGHNCWIGQDSILNATASLRIGNNVRIGTGSHLWTHVVSGELLEGCTLYGINPLVIENDVWIVGGAVISPNIVLKARSVIMPGSVVTKSTEENSCYAGVPAKNITDKILPYRPISLEEKWEMMKKFAQEFIEKSSIANSDNVIFIEHLAQDCLIFNNDCRIVITKDADVGCVDFGSNTSIFSLSSKNYRKRATKFEHDFIKFHVGHRARFVPAD